MNNFKAETRLRSEGSLRLKAESSRRAKRERDEWFEEAPIASSSSVELSVWELDHEFYQQDGKGVKMEEVEEGEKVKPTKKVLTRILEDYRLSLGIKKSIVAQQIQGLEKTKNDSYKCGLCGYKAEIQEKLEAHWSIGCDPLQVERKQGRPEAYQCSGCGVRMESIDLIESHMCICRHVLGVPTVQRATVANDRPQN